MSHDPYDKTAPQCAECLDEATTYETENETWYCDKHACDHSDHDGHCCLICGADLTETLAVTAHETAKARREDL